ncbi:MAG: cytidylate kinase-like family protein [Planctomycetota bacterium]|jgi:CheY-like chemotaxis protein
MAVVAIFSASYCHGEEVAKKSAGLLGYRYMAEEELLRKAAERYEVSGDKLLDALRGRSSFIEKLSGDKRAAHISFVCAIIAEEAEKDNIVFHGFASLLLPKYISHVLKVCLLADSSHRIAEAVKTGKDLSEKEAKKIIRKDDQESLGWAEFLFERSPWDAELYDVMIPTHERSIDEAVAIISESAGKEALRATSISTRAMDDFLLAARTHVELLKLSQDIEVKSDGGDVTVTILSFTWWLENLKKSIEKKALEIEGVKSVRFLEGPNYYPDRYRDELKLPSKVLLVDDEKEFVETLSERLQARNMDPALAYNGEEALEFVEKDKPDVMILDLRMPGIDGLEVLRRIKKEQPSTEVIILTGHGSEKDEEAALELGAFAYLQKPVDIELLTQAMKEAYRKVNESKNLGEGKTQTTE